MSFARTSTGRCFAPGSAVRVKSDWPETRGRCHIRTPHYIRGATGTILAHLGTFPNPEDLAFGRPATTVPLYHVRFDRLSLWQPQHAQSGTAGDDLVIEIFAHWLEPA